jgi:3-methyladenine DNA glycosylase AlkD
MKMNKLNQTKILKDIRAECSMNVTLTPEAAKRFFKTSDGDYGEHDAFLGVTVPALRKIAKKYPHTSLKILEILLQSKYNEERLLALLILVHKYQKSASHQQKEICQFYLKNLEHVNNWNLVDSSAHPILGHYLWDKDRSLLTKLAKSSVLWDKRVSIVATWYFIRKSDTRTTFEIAKLLLNDKHDLIHKAVGWMLREAGKKDETRLLYFLSEYAKQMPKTMLRYAIEKLTSEQRTAIEA